MLLTPVTNIKENDLKNQVCQSSTLSKREIEVLNLLVKGNTNNQISEILNISPLTVKTHRQKLLHKMGARNTAQLILNAGLKGLI